MENIVIKREGQTKDIVCKVTETGCWECISHFKDDKGYIRITVNNKGVKLHRYMYERYKNNIPKGLVIRHLCNNPSCCNPDHLEVGTHKDNYKDMVESNRAYFQNGVKRKWAENLKRLTRVLTLDGEEIGIFTMEEMVKLGYGEPSHISHCRNGKRKSHNGYRFEKVS